MKKTKQILSLFLSLCMIISCMAGISVTASAVEKPLAVGTIYNIGDAFVVSANGTRIVIDDDGNSKRGFDADSYVVPQPSYDNHYNQWYFNSDSFVLFLGYGTTDGTETVTGIKCVSGDGTTGNPYTFVLVCGAAPTAHQWTNGDVTATLSGTKLTVEKTGGAETGDMDVFWEPVGTAPAWADIKETITEIEIKDGVTDIGTRAFSGCKSLASVTIPDSVTVLGNIAFLDCEKLESVTIPNSVTSIASFTFEGCSSLTSVTIPDSVTDLGAYTFNRCTSLSSVTIPDSVTMIGVDAFRKCESLTSVTIPNSLTFIPDETFYGCISLSSVTFTPGTADTTLKIGNDTFYNTKPGAKVSYGTGNTVLYNGTTEITTDTLLTAIQNKTLTWKVPTYSITMSNGGKAYVNNEEVTSAPAGATVTVVAPQAEPGTQFNGWTTTTAGVVFADADSAETTFIMPESDAEITASFENILYSITVVNGTADKETAEAGQTVTVTADKRLGAVFTGWTSEDVVFKDASLPTTTFVMPIKNVTVTANYDAPYNKPVPAPSGGSTTPSHSSSSSSDVSGTSASGQKLRAVLNSNNSLTVDWDKISGASKYILYYEKNGKDVKVIETAKNKVTIKTAKNNFTYKFKLKYITSGQTLDAPTGYTATLKSYYKPAVKLTQKNGKVTASWKKVPGADSYKVYKVVNGKLKFVTETTKNAVRFSAKSGKTYTYTVSAVVNNTETKLTKSDRKSIKVK